MLLSEGFQVWSSGVAWSRCARTPLATSHSYPGGVTVPEKGFRSLDQRSDTDEPAGLRSDFAAAAEYQVIYVLN